jgi:hypothetical protein
MMKFGLAYISGYLSEDFFAKEYEVSNMSEAEAAVEQYYKEFNTKAQSLNKEKDLDLDPTPTVLCDSSEDYAEFGDELQDYIDCVITD